MTCEIAIMNMNAVTLAADSAMTVTRWVNGEEQKRYFKGTNKIFQLSNHQPVGLMVYGSANVQRVPWELIVKEYRSSLKTASYPSLKGYAEALFDYIRQHPTFFPTARRKEIYIDEVENAALAFFAKMMRSLKLSAAPANEEEKKKVLDDYIQKEIEVLQSEKLANGLVDGSDTKAYADHKVEIVAKMTAIVNWARGAKKLHADRSFDVELLALLANLTLFRRHTKVLSSSGIVIAGFGDQDLYPAYYEYRCYGFILDNFIYELSDDAAISLSSTSVVKPFATTSMVDTFLLGFSSDVYIHCATQFTVAANALLDAVKKELNVTDIPNVATHLGKADSDYRAAWSKAVADDHFRPLREVVASLPVDEMANLAETLVMLESLKEKVTSPTESVGGPVDVAVITKHEGLIWLKRKHYFDPEKNPRYFLRQQTSY